MTQANTSLPLTLWQDLGGRPLDPLEVDANFVALDEALTALRVSGAGFEGIATIEFDPDAGTVSILTNRNRQFGPFQLPSKPVRFRGPWVSGAGYVPGDLVVLDKTTYANAPGVYYVQVAHTAAATPAPNSLNPLGSVTLDVNAARLSLMVPAGKDATNFRSVYDATLKYNVTDQVLTIDTLTGFVTFWQMFYDAPAGNAPGSTIGYDIGGGQVVQIPIWGLVAVGNNIASSRVLDLTRSKTVDAIIADLYTKLGKLQTLAVNSNTRLNQYADTSHSNAYTPFTV